MIRVILVMLLTIGLTQAAFTAIDKVTAAQVTKSAQLEQLNK